MSKTDKFPPIKNVLVSTLIPYARNSRTHSDEQVSQIAASIREFGFLNPIIIDGDNGIIAGHGRVMAAQRLGIDSLPCVDASHLSDLQRRAYVIADNKLPELAGWNDEMLMLEFNDLAIHGFDLSLTGFDLDEISKIFDETKGVKIDDGIEKSEKDELLIRFNPKDRISIMNCINVAISDFKDASIWCDDEQV